MICAGIDAGSRAIKVALFDADSGVPLGFAAGDQGIGQSRRAERILVRGLTRINLCRNDIGVMVATGYGRENIEGVDGRVTEITCQTRGVRAVMPAARTIIDIGGQDSKLIRLDDAGRMTDFVMNDRCAAGTGRFLELVAERLDMSLPGLGKAAADSAEPASISSMCVVFAETEIVSLMAGGRAPESIAAGVCASIAARIASMAGREVAEPVVLTGGVARIKGMSRALTGVLGTPVAVASRPQFTCALGAALIAAERAIKNSVGES